jgi:hypothetical protein
MLVLSYFNISLDKNIKVLAKKIVFILEVLQAGKRL